MALFLLFLRECGDESLVEYITLLEERIFFCHFPLDALRLAFTIALGRESLFFYPMLDEILYWSEPRQSVWADNSIVTLGFSFSSFTSSSRAVCDSGRSVALSKS